MTSSESSQTLFDFFRAGGFIMVPLLLCSIAACLVIVERLWRFRGLAARLREFHLSAVSLLLQQEWQGLADLARAHPDLPTAPILQTALDRRAAKDRRVRECWAEAVERQRQGISSELRRLLWILGTTATAAPFIGLFGTVVGILRSFQEMAKTGTGGFNVVAAGISEALIATAAGILIAVVALVAYNGFQVQVARWTLLIRQQVSEWVELFGDPTEKG